MCGVFGAYSTNGSPVLEDVYLGLCALQHRGQLSAGVAWTADGTIHVKKALGLVHEALSQNELAQIPEECAHNAHMFHIRLRLLAPPGGSVHCPTPRSPMAPPRCSGAESTRKHGGGTTFRTHSSAFLHSIASSLRS